MFFAIKIAEALGLGLYSCVVLRYYSILVSRTKSDVIRLLLFLAGITLIIALPGLGCMLLLDRCLSVARTWTPNERMAWLFALFICWMGPVYVYVIRNWRTLDQRLRLPKEKDPKPEEPPVETLL